MSPAYPFFKMPHWQEFLQQLQEDHNVEFVEEEVPGAKSTPLRYLKREAKGKVMGYPLDDTDLKRRVEGPWVIGSILAALRISAAPENFAGE